MPINDILERLRQGTVGATSPELISAANNRNADIAPATPGLKGDKALHFIASREAAKRLGPAGSDFLGFAQEATSGISNLASGGNFFEKDKGFDFADIAANQQGINAAEGEARTSRQSLEKRVQENGAEQASAKEDSEIAEKATDPVSRKRALMNALNRNVPGIEGGMAGILSALGGPN